MTSKEIRQSFLDFFAENRHSIVPSASLLPTSPNLLFTNAGMNQFVPYFLGSEQSPYQPPRASDTQKCIRAGGKHNDLEDVGFDTYHQTFFEMLGNWSFGDYFKQEAISWAWELLVERWGFPPERLYASVYEPSEGDPGDFDQEAYDCWAEKFESSGLDPTKHVVKCGVKDNFWMMGETGPCGPCSEVHIDLTPKGDTGGSLVNQDDPLCIEIWNLVFIQYNAEPDGSYRSLPARHVDTGMGFERVCSAMQCTNGFTDFSRPVSNYETDVFKPIFEKISKLSGKNYSYGRPPTSSVSQPEEADRVNVAFRILADHVRTLSFAVADGIIPGNVNRHYVLRRILRRALRYARNLGLGGDGMPPVLATLAEVVIEEFGEVFPELRQNAKRIAEVLSSEEESFMKTLDRGVRLFEEEAERIGEAGRREFPADTAFDLYHTYGFPLDLTELMLKERGFTLNTQAVEELMEIERNRSRKAQKTEIVLAEDELTETSTKFEGFEKNALQTEIIATLRQGKTALQSRRKRHFTLRWAGRSETVAFCASMAWKFQLWIPSARGGRICTSWASRFPMMSRRLSMRS